MTPNAIGVIITRENDNGATEILLQKNNKLGLIRILINKAIDILKHIFKQIFMNNEVN